MAAAMIRPGRLKPLRNYSGLRTDSASDVNKGIALASTESS